MDRFQLKCSGLIIHDPLNKYSHQEHNKGYCGDRMSFFISVHLLAWKRQYCDYTVHRMTNCRSLAEVNCISQLAHWIQNLDQMACDISLPGSCAPCDYAWEWSLSHFIVITKYHYLSGLLHTQQLGFPLLVGRR